MPDLKFQQINGGVTTTPSGTDILPYVHDPSGSPADRQATVDSLIAKADLPTVLGNTASGATASTVQNSIGITQDIPIDATDVLSHVWSWTINTDELFEIGADGDGTGNIVNRLARLDAEMDFQGGALWQGGQFAFGQITPPDDPLVSLVSPAAPGNVNNGQHFYKITYLTVGGQETDASPGLNSVTVINKSVNGQVLLNIPSIPPGIRYGISNIKIYRTVVGDPTTFYLLASVSTPNSTYIDNIADATILGGFQPPAENGTGLIYGSRFQMNGDRPLLVQGGDSEFEYPIDFTVGHFGDNTKYYITRDPTPFDGITINAPAGKKISLSCGLETLRTTEITPLSLTQQQGSGTAVGPIINISAGSHLTYDPITSSIDALDINFNFNRTVQFKTGNLSYVNDFMVSAPTFSFVGASTISDASAVTISGAPIAGTNATITRSMALWVQSGAARFDGQIQMLGSQKIHRISTAIDYNILTSDYYIGVTSTAAPRTITLPSAVTVGNGGVYIIKDESGGAAINNITIATTGGQTIDGSSSVIINTNYSSITVNSDGSNWFIF